jgi:hypothetical protein
MLKHKIFLHALMFSIILSACGPAKLSPQPTAEQIPLPTSIPSPVSSADWDISLTQSGGIAGVSRSLELQSNGMVVVVDECSGKRIERQLTQDEISKINQLLNSFSFQKLSTPMGCADCFFYTLQIRSGGRVVDIQSDEVNLNGTGAENLIGYLSNLMSAMLSNG